VSGLSSFFTRDSLNYWFKEESTLSFIVTGRAGCASFFGRKGILLYIKLLFGKIWNGGFTAATEGLGSTVGFLPGE